MLKVSIFICVVRKEREFNAEEKCTWDLEGKSRKTICSEGCSALEVTLSISNVLKFKANIIKDIKLLHVPLNTLSRVFVGSRSASVSLMRPLFLEKGICFLREG